MIAAFYNPTLLRFIVVLRNQSYPHRRQKTNEQDASRLQLRVSQAFQLFVQRKRHKSTAHAWSPNLGRAYL